MNSQLKKGVLDICVLAILEKEDLYGYGLKQKMSELMDINENTLYPLLRRLEKDNLLSTYLDKSGVRERKYYQITSEGKKHLILMRDEWNTFKKQVEIIIGGDYNE